MTCYVGKFPKIRDNHKRHHVGTPCKTLVAPGRVEDNLRGTMAIVIFVLLFRLSSQEV